MSKNKERYTLTYTWPLGETTVISFYAGNDTVAIQNANYLVTKLEFTAPSTLHRFVRDNVAIEHYQGHKPKTHKGKKKK